jgi:hypothetical protein
MSATRFIVKEHMQNMARGLRNVSTLLDIAADRVDDGKMLAVEPSAALELSKEYSALVIKFTSDTGALIDKLLFAVVGKEEKDIPASQPIPEPSLITAAAEAKEELLRTKKRRLH